MSNQVSEPIRLFNSELESGIRSAALLLAVFPNTCDLQRLVQYDYLVVHSGDVSGGPASLHPATPHRAGELLVRRRIVEAGLELMTTRLVVSQTFTAEGISFVAGEYALTFLDSLSTDYASTMRHRALWVSERFQAFDDDELRAFMQSHWAHWGAEFIRPNFIGALDE